MDACPAHIHALQHGGPVHGIRAAGAGVYFQDGALGVFFCAQQDDHLCLVQLCSKRAQLRFQLFKQFFLLGTFCHACQFLQGVHVLPALSECRVEGVVLFQAALFLKDGLQGFMIVPGARLCQLFFYLSQFFLCARDVKDASRDRGTWKSVAGIGGEAGLTVAC